MASRGIGPIISSASSLPTPAAPSSTCTWRSARPSSATRRHHSTSRRGSPRLRWCAIPWETLSRALKSIVWFRGPPRAKGGISLMSQTKRYETSTPAARELIAYPTESTPSASAFLPASRRERRNLTIRPEKHTASSRRFADCTAGVQHSSQRVCCNATCGLCGGHGCSTRPGGPRQCCMPAILRTGRVCESRADVACILHEHPSYSARAHRWWGFASTNKHKQARRPST
mmetsp:Transcript_47702/g.159029  ORF Transcript_47702/g.159029 Transcript_47702/m.159029 type:complete len:230 (+) Transcript_47702:1405-2094(+)